MVIISLSFFFCEKSQIRPNRVTGEMTMLNGRCESRNNVGVALFVLYLYIYIYIYGKLFFDSTNAYYF